MSDFRERITNLDDQDANQLLEKNLTPSSECDSLSNHGWTRYMINDALVVKFEEEEIDEIELLIIESGY
jgi:hypothetical protein